MAGHGEESRGGQLIASTAVLVRLLADDLTGALDSGVRLLPAAGSLRVTWKAPASAGGSVAVDLGTRESSPDDAAARAAAVARDVFATGAIRFLKCDSLLRGNAAAELRACLAVARLSTCIIAPAFPAQGRITRGGRQLARAMTGASPAAFLPVGADLAAELRALGCAVTICDPGAPVPDGVSFWNADSDAALAAVVAAGRRHAAPVLWCGSAGLAGALAGGPAPPAARLRRPLLALLGSDHPVTAGQLDHARDWHVPLDATDPGAHAGITARLADGAAVVTVALPAGLARPAAAGHIARAFAGLLALPPPATLFVTGGETLRALCDAAGARALDVRGEVAPGVPVSTMLGGVWDGVTTVSKSGAFGEAALLHRLLVGAV